MNSCLPFRWTKSIVLGLILLAGSAGEALAANLRIEAKLIWATDESKSPDSSHKPLDAAMCESLRKMFKWKNYFEVNRLVKDVPARSSNKFELSKRCTIEIKELEGPRIEVKLIGEGKELHKTILNISKGKPLVYTGPDKDQNAWFVIITELEEK